MQKWEYTSLYIYEGKGDKWVFDYQGKTFPETDRNRVMGDMGQQGWELVCAVPFEGFETGFGKVPSTYTRSYTLMFKRPVA